MTEYQKGASITLNEQPSSGYIFTGWGGACSGTSTQCTVTMDSARSVSAAFALARTLTVVSNPSAGGSISSNPPGISCPSDCSQVYADGTSVALTATPAKGYRFVNWSGACPGSTSNTCNVTMNADRRGVTANFVLVFTLRINVSGNGSVSYSPVGDGSGTCTSSCLIQYDAATQVTLTAAAGNTAVFSGWGDACASFGTDVKCTLTMDKDNAVTAQFTGLNRLDVTVNGSGSVTGSGINCSSACTNAYPPGTQVTLTAAAGNDPFATWGGDCASSGTQPSCTLTMDTNKSVTATFAPLAVTAPHFRLTVGVTGAGKVTTSGIDCSTQVEVGCQSDYVAGSSLTLVGVPESGVNFQAWGGACASFGTQQTCTLAMDNNKSVTATFSTNPVVGDLPPCRAGLQSPLCEENQLPGPTHGLLVSLSGAEGGKVTGGPSGSALTLAASGETPPPIACGEESYVCYGDYTPGQRVTLKAKPAEGFIFVGWTGACKGRHESCPLRLSEIRKVVAAFAPKGKRLLSMSMSAPEFHVQWNESTGRGKLVVTGRIAGPAQLTIDLRRPHAGPLLQLRKSVKAGAFRIVQPLRSRFFPKGARLLPGGKVVSIRGKARPLYVPMQVRTVQLDGPREGVVRRSFASVTRAGRSVPVFSPSTKVAWANFRLEKQPQPGLALQVSWYWPNGHVLGSVRKANRPIVSSFLRSGQPLPRGCWHAKLFAGEKLLSRQSVRIGSGKC